MKRLEVHLKTPETADWLEDEVELSINQRGEIQFEKVILLERGKRLKIVDLTVPLAEKVLETLPGVIERAKAIKAKEGE